MVTDREGFALYFSRAPIPWNRDSAPAGLTTQTDFGGARRHRGLYAYRVAALLRLAQLPRGTLEEREQLEQLRALENAMDHENLAALRRRAPEHVRERVRLFLEFAPQPERQEVPDPYYGGPNGFEEVLDLVESAARGLLSYLRQHTRAA